uniref:Complex I-MWFE n=1 Tax=Heterorhabditis bacteriophora TaxID=37862 RepID=A0A1I7WAF4_HETBA
MTISAYGPVATIFLIFFNVPYRKFLSEKLREFGYGNAKLRKATKDKEGSYVMYHSTEEMIKITS